MGYLTNVIEQQNLTPVTHVDTQNITLAENENLTPIIERALRKSHVNGATKVKLYSYRYSIGIRQVLGRMSKLFHYY